MQMQSLNPCELVSEVLKGIWKQGLGTFDIVNQQFLNPLDTFKILSYKLAQFFNFSSSELNSLYNISFCYIRHLLC